MRKRTVQHSEDVLAFMGDVRQTVESLGRSIDGPGDRDAALDLAKEVKIALNALIDHLHTSMENP